jgi:hypothetical protein
MNIEIKYIFIDIREREKTRLMGEFRIDQKKNFDEVKRTRQM